MLAELINPSAKTKHGFCKLTEEEGERLHDILRAASNSKEGILEFIVKKSQIEGLNDNQLLFLLVCFFDRHGRAAGRVKLQDQLRGIIAICDLGRVSVIDIRNEKTEGDEA